MLKKILGWVKGKPAEGSGLQVGIEMLKPELPDFQPAMEKKPDFRQPDPVCPHCGFKIVEMPARLPHKSPY